MELDAASLGDLRASGVTMHINKVHHVTTIDRVADSLGEDENWLSDVANEMDAEDGLIWVYGVGENGVMAFTDFGIETLTELIRIHKENPKLRRG
jgi:predicted RecB family nuclease